MASLAADVAIHSETIVLDKRPAGDFLGSLTAAAAAGLRARFSYTDQHGIASHRMVDSLRCLFIRGRWSVLAYDNGRTDWRVFRLDRMCEVMLSDGPAPRRDPPAEDLATWLLTDFGKAGGAS